MASFQWVDKYTCCNPFGRTEHIGRKKTMRCVSKGMCEKMPSLSLGSKICDVCRKKLAKLPSPFEHFPDPDSASPPVCASLDTSSSEEELLLGTSQSRILVNECMESLGETPFTKRKL